MKSVKSLLALAAIFGAATTASAATPSTTATIIRLTGSTAYRSPTQTVLKALFTVSGSEPLIAWDSTSTAYVGSNSGFIWGHIGSTEVILETTFTGSVGGIQSVAGNGSLTVAWLPDTLADGTPVATTAGVSTGTNPLVTLDNLKPADLTMADNFQSATPFRTPVLTDNTVAIVPFTWVTNPGLTATVLSATTTAATAQVTLADTTGLTVGERVFSSKIPATTIASVDSSTQITLTTFSGVTAGTANASFVPAGANPISNMNPQIAQALFGNGSASLALFTGNHADESSSNANGTVYAIGRDPDSGTRVIEFAESGIGVSSTVVQYQPTLSGSAVTSQIPWPQETVDGIVFTQGNGGYNSGSGLRTPLEATTSGINGYYVGFLGISDANTVKGLGGQWLTWNGVPFSVTAVEEGQYTAWSYEHLMYQPTLASNKKTLAASFVTALQGYATDTAKGTSISLSDMKVVRLSDGGVITQNY